MRRKDLLRTLFSRMLAVYMTVIFSLIVLLGVAVIVIIRGQTYGSRQDLVRMESVEVLNIEKQRVSGAMSEAEAKQKLYALAVGNNLLIEIYPTGGEPEHYYGRSSWSSVADYEPDEERKQLLIAEAAAGNTETKQYYQDISESKTLTKIATLPDSGTVTHLILVHADTSEISEALNDLILIVVLVLLVGLLIGLIVVYSTTSAVIKPFREVNDIVQQYSMGDYNARIPISGTEETIQLALSFNNMADQLEDLEATRQSFVANVSHELRSPLTSMKGFLEAMHDGTIVKEEYDQYIDIVLTETKRMASMVNDLLDLARIESGKSVLKLEVFDINELIRRILITFEARIYERKMDVEIRFAQEQFYVEADSTQISQVIRNLIDNAIKYSPENSKLRIATYAMRKEVYISIQDFGQGIPEEDVPRVFDRFYKVEKAHTPSKQSGTGLGLSIVKRIIDQHGQKITLKSARGKGSTFTFTLKRAPVPKRTQQDQNGGMIHEQY